jgi:hypothetical protein
LGIREENEFMAKWVNICTVQGGTKAAIIRGRLEAEGIPVDIDYEAIGKVAGISVDGIGAVRISVPEEFVRKAEEILREAGEVD